MGAPFEFEVLDVPTPTVEQVSGRLADRQGCIVVGGTGSGKTHALRRAVNGAVWVDLTEGPLQQAAFFVDVARQVHGGEQILRAAAAGEFRRAREAVGEALRGQCLVVDRAERLVDSAPARDWSERADALWQDELQPLFEWLTHRISTSATVLSSRRRLKGIAETDTVRHQPPVEWPVKLTRAAAGYRDWRGVAEAVGARPGGLLLARALIPLLSAEAFNELLDSLRWEDMGPLEAIRALGRSIAAHSSAAWARVLGLIDALEGAPRALVEEVLDEGDAPVLVALIKLGIIEEIRGQLAVQATASSAGALRTIPARERTALFQAAARRLLDSVNDLASIDARSAEKVLRAHRLYLALGDFTNARQTARLHLAGLIDLARRTSVAGDWNEARDQYQLILDMLSGTGAAKGSLSGRARSYVVHYRAYNGKRGGSLAAAEILEGYQEAARLWPENALWQSRVIGQLIELGRSRDALERMEAAYQRVEEHPRRDFFLRVVPAQRAMRCGAPVLALQICEPILDISADVDPEGAAKLQALLARWDRGCAVDALRREGGGIVFRQPLEVSLRQTAGGSWRARSSALDEAGQGDGPLAAITDLARNIGDEACRLVGTPSHRLDQAQVLRKARLIAALDMLNSDIGLRHATHRWLLGTLEQGRFHPVQAELEDAPLGPDLAAVSGNGLYFGRFPVYRDGVPSGPADTLVPAGSGRSLLELMQALRELPNREHG